MSNAVHFLTSLSQALSTISLYTEGHPARAKVIHASWDALNHLVGEGQGIEFTFLGGEVVFGNRVLRELKDWDWSNRLASVGVERLEFVPPIPLEEFQAFVGLVHGKLKAPEGDRLLEPVSPATGIRYGRVTVGGESLDELARRVVAATVSYDLTAEVEGARWVYEQVATSEELPVVETETIVRSLALAMRQQGELMLPLLELRELDQYATAHSCNVSVLAMGLAEYLGYAPREARLLGVAGMLADIGNVRVPKELLLQTGKLSDAERRLVEDHCVQGARIILQRHPRMELAAVVAYEHHLDLSGAGYPRLVFPREPHFASRLIRICDFYDAAMSPRSWRPSLGGEQALKLLQDGAGTHFDPDLVGPFATMLRQARVERLAFDHPVVEVEGVEVGEDGSN
ncbi:MAG: HD-GYP domain-containing protein [Gemmatimonadales bacterium]